MGRYVISIASDDGAVENRPRTTVRVDTSSGETRITELTVRAPEGGGLAQGDLPVVDLDLLTRALTGPHPALAMPPAISGPPDTPLGVAEPAEDAPVNSSTAPSGAAASGSTERGQRAAAGRRGPAKKSAGAGRGRRGRGSKTAGRADVAQGGTPAAGTRGGRSKGAGSRPYRRMPDASEVLTAYQKAGTVAGLAEHFGVPRYTANSWLRTMRRQGAIGE